MNFITVEQYQFIKKQGKRMVNAQTTSRDKKVIEAIQALIQEEINQKITFTDIELQLKFQPIFYLQTKEQLEQFILGIKEYVEPFQQPSETEIKKLFPKDKKLRIPKLNELDLKEISYLSWIDSGTNRKYLVYREDGELQGVRGVFSHSEKVGICTVCNQHSKVGMLLVAKSGSSLGTYTKRGNYICQDSISCNEALTDLKKFFNFVENLK